MGNERNEEALEIVRWARDAASQRSEAERISGADAEAAQALLFARLIAAVEALEDAIRDANPPKEPTPRPSPTRRKP
jgi:hypothetical protein